MSEFLIIAIVAVCTLVTLVGLLIYLLLRTIRAGSRLLRVGSTIDNHLKVR